MIDAQRLLGFQVELRLELSIDQQALALTSDGLLMRNERTGSEWRVPSDDTAKLRSLAALPKSTTADVTARRCAVARAVDGKVSREIARQLGAMHHDDA